MSTHLIEHIDEKQTVLTPNRRLAASLHGWYQEKQIKQHKTAWKTPDILPILSWIKRTWQDYTLSCSDEHPLLLNTLQEFFLWEKMIATAKYKSPLLQITETAELARSAFSLLKQWNASYRHPLFNTSEDYLNVQHWLSQFDKHCQRHNLIDQASLPTLVNNLIQQNKIKCPEEILLIGFTELSPQIQNIITSCQKKRSRVTQINAGVNKAHCARITGADLEDEIRTMACWSKQLYQTTDESIACVVPNLEKERDRIWQIFAEVFAEDNALSIHPDNAPFNISAGKSLARYPVIQTALQLLSLHQATLSLDGLSALFASPFLAHAESERIKRAKFDLIARRKNMNRLDLRSTATINFISKYCPQFARSLRDFFNLLKEQPSFATHHYWVQLFTKLLTVWGWPGERSLNSEEFQTVDNWLSLLSEFATLQHIAEEIPLSLALQSLHKLAIKRVFQPKTPTTRIQILGVLEAAGLAFSQVWMMGMDDLNWPKAPNPHPFIPKRIQSDLQMPHASAVRELNYCNALLQQFKSNSQQIIFSHAQSHGDLAQEVSPLIRDEVLIEKSGLNLASIIPANLQVFQSRQLESILDDTAPALLPQEKIKGGVNILKYQAACPFRAFAEWRLHAHELELTQLGFRAKERGTLMHSALETLWQKIPDHSTLLHTTEEKLNLLINEAIETAISTVIGFEERQHYLKLEKKRLHKLLSKWLTLEKTRPPFKVANREKNLAVTLSQLQLSIRIDRIDELADGRKLIIDYKTSKNNEINSWFTDRPDEPQLPLYALFDESMTAGISFAQVCASEMGFKGISCDALEIKGIQTFDKVRAKIAASWTEQISEWRQTLTNLSEDFCKGKSSVNPKNKTQTCTFCSLKPLCRVYEQHE